MLIAKTLTTALSRHRCHEGHSPTCAVCAQRRLQVQQQLGAEDQNANSETITQKFPLFFPCLWKVATETSWVKVTRLTPLTTKSLRISASVVRLALWVSGSQRLISCQRGPHLQGSKVKHMPGLNDYDTSGCCQSRIAAAVYVSDADGSALSAWCRSRFLNSSGCLHPWMTRWYPNAL